MFPAWKAFPQPLLGRTFIEGSNRADKARLKYTPLPQVLEGKRVLLVEDTIVRSTTMKALISQLREKGRAREVHVRVACPPIIAPCYYGIDMSTIGELFAPKFMQSFAVEFGTRSRDGRGPRCRQPALLARLGDRPLREHVAGVAVPGVHRHRVPDRSPADGSTRSPAPRPTAAPKHRAALTMLPWRRPACVFNGLFVTMARA